MLEDTGARLLLVQNPVEDSMLQGKQGEKIEVISLEESIYCGDASNLEGIKER